MSQELIRDIVDNLSELKEDMSIPRNVKSRILETIKLLEEEGETSIKVNKALHFLDEIAEDTNMQSYTRTQIWNVVSALERI